MAAYHFRPLDRKDLPLIARWLESPEVARWWGDPQGELDLITGDFDEPAMRQWLVEWKDRPFAYVQTYRSGAWPQAHLEHLSPETAMVDAFIGEPAMLGVGHGGAFLREFAEKLIAEGAPQMAIDPAAENLRARRAYARAGFVGERVTAAAEGPAVVMVFQG